MRRPRADQTCAFILAGKPFTHRTGHDLDHLDPNLPIMEWCAGSVQYRSKPGIVLDPADITASTQERELDHTDQECIFPEMI